jgi:hypothetical protein
MSCHKEKFTEQVPNDFKREVNKDLSNFKKAEKKFKVC